MAKHSKSSVPATVAPTSAASQLSTGGASITAVAAPPAVTASAVAAPPAVVATVQAGAGINPPAPAAPEKLGPVASNIAAKLLAFMQPGQSYTSRQLVLALGRACGQKEGQPVVNVLNKLRAQGKVAGSQQGAGLRAPWVWQLPS